MRINEIKLDVNVRYSLRKELRQMYGEPEMTEFESGFLCGLLEEYKPQKVIEIGVAAGYTTAIILKCLEDMNYDYQMYSVDASKAYYRGDGSQLSGFVAQDYIDKKDIRKHVFFLGESICHNIGKIGGEIDFLILDTMHSLPGEILDFLVLLPYLKDGAVVCLHDVSLNNRVRGWGFQNATNILYHAVVGEKLFNLVPNKKEEVVDYPNIAAFRINDDTKKYVENVFLSLLMTWHYMPSANDLASYGEIIKNNYDKSLYHIFQNATWMNCRMAYPFPERLLKAGERIVIYGAGNVGREYMRQLSVSGFAKVVAWLDKNYESIQKQLDIGEIEVQNPQKLSEMEYDHILISVLSYPIMCKIYEELLALGALPEKIIWAGNEVYEF